jgi:integrase
VLHRIAFPVVSEWYQQSHSSFTILLTRGTHPKYVQHLAGHVSIQLILDRYSHWMLSMGRNTAEGMDEVLG